MPSVCLGWRGCVVLVSDFCLAWSGRSAIKGLGLELYRFLGSGWFPMQSFPTATPTILISLPVHVPS